VKLSLTQENLARALGSVGRLVSARASLPVLSNILLCTDGNRLRLSATNLEIGINYWVGSKVEQEGSLTVPARLLTDFVTSLPAGVINLESSGAILTISSPHFESKINGLAADDFPTIPQITDEPAVRLSSAVLKEALSRVVIAASLDEARPVLAGVYLRAENGELVVAATDSYRLAEKRLQLPDGSTAFQVIVPARTIQEVLRLLGDVSDEVEIYLDDTQVMFRLGDVELVSRLIEGRFPPYQQIIPTRAESSFDIDTAEFARLVKVAGLFARESAGSVRLAIREDGEIAVSSADSEVGGNKSTAECEVAGGDNEVSLNARYLQDATTVMKSARMRFSMTDKLSACVLAPADDDSYVHVIMPLRT